MLAHIYRLGFAFLSLGAAMASDAMPPQDRSDDLFDVNIIAGNKSSCHGVKISDIVITAAHCIRHGETYTVSANIGGNIYKYKAARAHAHPGYEKNDNDVAVLVLPEFDPLAAMNLESVFSQYINVSRIFFTTRTIILDYQNKTPITDDEYYDLVQTRQFFRGKPIFRVSHQFLQGKKYFCQGASGAPVYTFRGERRVLYGIITKGISITKGELGERCGDTLLVEPLSEHMDWIKEVSKQ